MEEILQAPRYSLSKDRRLLLLENIISHVPHFIFWKDTQSAYLGCNYNYAKLIGLDSPQQLIGKTDYDLDWCSDGDTADFFRLRDKEAMSGKHIRNLEQILSLPDGKKLVVLVDKVPLFDENSNVIGILAVATDITALKESEVELMKAKRLAEVANVAKATFLANMSHDLRTLLNGIIGCTEILRMKTKDSENLEFVNGIYNSGKLLLNLMEGILDFSKAESESVTYVETTFNLKEVVQQVVSAMHEQAQRKGITMDLNFIGRIPAKVIGDCNYLRRVLVNLLGNSVKFTNQGSITTTVKYLGKKGDQGLFEIMVEDTGIGIPEDKFEYIFDRFTRVDPAYNSQYPGNGLGLAIVKQALNKMKGDIRVFSEVGKGTQFLVKIPLRAE